VVGVKLADGDVGKIRLFLHGETRAETAANLNVREAPRLRNANVASSGLTCESGRAG
jgi:hypothetical protein